MPADVAGIEEPLAFRFDLQGISVVGRMIDEMRNDPERSDFERNAARKLERRRGNIGMRYEGRRRLQNSVRRGAKVNRNVRSGEMGQAPMVDMSVRKHEAQKVGTTRKAFNLRMAGGVGRIAVERQPEIEQNPTADCCQLNARATDLGRPSVDFDAHPKPSRFGPGVVRSIYIL